MDNNKNRMTIETANSFPETINKMLEIYETDGYIVDFFGGEPLLNFDVIKHFVENVIVDDKRCKSIGVITNGLMMTDEILEFLQQHKIRISWSFDGLWNSFNRPLVGGASSFDKYIEKRHFFEKFAKSCKVMVGPDSISTLTENLEFFMDDFTFVVPDFSLVRDDIWSKDGIEKYKIEIKRFADRVIKYNIDGKYCFPGFFFIYALDTIIGSKVHHRRKHGCFAGVSGCAIAPNGDVYPCARFVSDKSLKLYDGNTKTITDYNLIQNLKIEQPLENLDECKSCELEQLCSGGCTFSQIQFGSLHKPKPVASVCELYKLTYKETFRVMHAIFESPTAEILRNTIKTRLGQNG